MTAGRRTLLKALFTTALLGYLAYRMDLREFARELASVRPGLLIVAVAVQFGAILMAVARWRTILGNFNIHSGLGPLTRITFIGHFFSLFLPSGIGGDFFRAYYLSRREGRGMSTTLTTTFLERSGGLCSLLVIGALFATVHEVHFHGVPLLYLFLLVALGYVAANLALFNTWIHRRITEILKRWDLENVEVKISLVSEGLQTLRRNPVAIGVVLLLSLVIQLLSVFIMWIAALSIGINTSFYYFLVFIPIVNLTIMIPLTINGFGLREGVYALLFAQIGVPTETAVTLSLLNFAIAGTAALPGAVLYSFYKKDERFAGLPNAEVTTRTRLIDTW